MRILFLLIATLSISGVLSADSKTQALAKEIEALESIGNLYEKTAEHQVMVKTALELLEQKISKQIRKNHKQLKYYQERMIDNPDFADEYIADIAATEETIQDYQDLLFAVQKLKMKLIR